MNGNEIIILRNWTAIAGTRTDKVKTTAETIEVSGPQSGQWVERIAGRKDWSLNTNYLVLAPDGISSLERSQQGIGDLLRVGEIVTIVIHDRENKKIAVTGHAIIESCDQEYRRGSLVQGNFSFVGSGALTRIKIETFAIETTPLVIDAGQRHTIDVSWTPLTAPGNFKWSTSDSRVATVSDGVVTGVSPGVCNITCQPNDSSTLSPKTLQVTVH
jgi:predicted secreted protein